MKPVKTLFLSLALCLAMATSGGSYSGVNWTSLEAAQDSAKSGGKMVYLHFYTDWCGYCKKMDSTTFKDPKVVAYLNENFLSVRLNPEKSEAAKEVTPKFRVRGFPANGFSMDGQTPLTSIPGYMPPEQFLTVLKYLASSSYKAMSFQDFAKNTR